jgi:hypothetical protein
MITINKIETNLGIRCLSSHFTSGYITKASKIAIVKGKMTADASFNTATTRIKQIKNSREKIARPE